MHYLVADKVPIERLDVSVYTVPTKVPETDGTREWDSTTVIVVEPTAGGSADGLLDRTEPRRLHEDVRDVRHHGGGPRPPVGSTVPNTPLRRR
jgi:hypothetical protein